jgi:HNH endonuclease
MPPHFRHESSMQGLIDFSAEPAVPEQHSRATSIFSQIISHYEQSQTLKPYKRITLIRATHEYAISQETFLSYFFVGIHNQLVGDEESVSNSSFSQALAHFANFESWDTERKDVLRERLCGFADYLLDNFFLPCKHTLLPIAYTNTDVDYLVKASGRKTPQPSPSPHSVTQPGQQLSGTSQRLSTLRHNCLIRDRHRCVVSHKFDKNEAIRRAQRDGNNATDDDGYWLRDERMELDYLEVAHILPHSLMSFKASDGQSQLVCSEYICSQLS